MSKVKHIYFVSGGHIKNSFNAVETPETEELNLSESLSTHTSVLSRPGSAASVEINGAGLGLGMTSRRSLIILPALPFIHHQTPTSAQHSHGLHGAHRRSDRGQRCRETVQ